MKALLSELQAVRALEDIAAIPRYLFKFSNMKAHATRDPEHPEMPRTCMPSRAQLLRPLTTEILALPMAERMPMLKLLRFRDESSGKAK